MGHETTARVTADCLYRRRRIFAADRGIRHRPADRGGGLIDRCLGGTDRSLSAVAGGGGPLWLPAHSQFRNAVRQSRQWLADWRWSAASYGPGRRARIALRRADALAG